MFSFIPHPESSERSFQLTNFLFSPVIRRTSLFMFSVLDLPARSPDISLSRAIWLSEALKPTLFVSEIAIKLHLR